MLIRQFYHAAVYNHAKIRKNKKPNPCNFLGAETEAVFVRYTHCPLKTPLFWGEVI